MSDSVSASDWPQHIIMALVLSSQTATCPVRAEGPRPARDHQESDETSYSSRLLSLLFMLSKPPKTRIRSKVGSQTAVCMDRPVVPVSCDHEFRATSYRWRSLKVFPAAAELDPANMYIMRDVGSRTAECRYRAEGPEALTLQLFADTL